MLGLRLMGIMVWAILGMVIYVLNKKVFEVELK